jgi:hypothetical protein
VRSGKREFILALLETGTVPLASVVHLSVEAPTASVSPGTSLVGYWCKKESRFYRTLLNSQKYEGKRERKQQPSYFVHKKAKIGEAGSKNVNIKQVKAVQLVESFVVEDDSIPWSSSEYSEPHSAVP